MRPDVYQALIDLAKHKDQKAAEIIVNAIKQNNQEDLSLTIKGYSQNQGLSAFIFDDLKGNKQQKYQIHGPMGKGLNPQNEGLHAAYAAGTGVLVFADMVGHLILKQVAAQGGPDVFKMLGESAEGIPSLPDNFKFNLKTSFFDEDEAIALELIEALEQLDPEKKVFEHAV